MERKREEKEGGRDGEVGMKERASWKEEIDSGRVREREEEEIEM